VAIFGGRAKQKRLSVKSLGIARDFAARPYQQLSDAIIKKRCCFGTIGGNCLVQPRCDGSERIEQRHTASLGTKGPGIAPCARSRLGLSSVAQMKHEPAIRCGAVSTGFCHLQCRGLAGTDCRLWVGAYCRRRPVGVPYGEQAHHTRHSRNHVGVEWACLPSDILLADQSRGQSLCLVFCRAHGVVRDLYRKPGNFSFRPGSGWRRIAA